MYFLVVVDIMIYHNFSSLFCDKFCRSPRQRCSFLFPFGVEDHGANPMRDNIWEQLCTPYLVSRTIAYTLAVELNITLVRRKMSLLYHTQLVRATIFSFS